FFFSSRRRHTRFSRDWSSDVCSSDLRVVNATRWPPSEVSVQSASAAGKNADRPTVRAHQRVGGQRNVLATERGIGALHIGGRKRESEERRVGKEWRYGWERRQSKIYD